MEKEINDDLEFIKYDIRVFEELPPLVQADKIENSIVILDDEVDLSYHFYKCRKKCRDNKYRTEKYSFSSTAEMIETRRKCLDEQA